MWDSKKRFAYLTALAVGTTLLIAACGSSSSSSTSSLKKTSAAPYKTVIVGSLTGSAGVDGTDFSAGVEAAFKEINAAGGIKGHQIQFQSYDDQSSATVAPAVARQAVGQHPVAILDGSVSTYLGDRLPVYKSAQIPVFSNQAVGFGYYPWLYSDVNTVYQAASSIVTMASQVLGGSLQGKKVAYVGADTAAVIGYVSTIKPLIAKQGGTLSATEYQTIGAPSFAAGAAKVLNSKPDAVVIVDTEPDGVVEAKALLAAGYNGPIISNYGAAGSAWFKAVGSPKLYGQYLMPPVSTGTPAYAIAQKYGLLDKTSTINYQQGWVMAYTLVNGLKNCTFPCTPTQLESAVDALGDYTVPADLQFGSYTVSKSTHNVLKNFGVYTWDPKSQQPVPFGKPLPFGPPNYIASK